MYSERRTVARILIVDDDEMDRLMERSILDGMGHTLLFASDGDVALSVYRKEEVDLVITDLAMPELNGLRLIQAILELDPGARIIAVSGYNDEQLDLAASMGAVSTLFKPLEYGELLAAVEEALKGQSPGGDPWAFTTD